MRPFTPLVFLAVLCCAAPALSQDREIRYAVIGDSYSSGEGATPEQSWPALLARHLHDDGLQIKLVANPSRTGWTTQDALDEEMPIFRTSRPDFATVQIGVNDWVRGVTASRFRKNFVLLLEEMLAVLPEKKKLLVVTIPDFSVTPSGSTFGEPPEISRGISEFNKIIEQEAATRGLKVADVFPLSQKMRGDSALVAADGLHPSAKEYALWEKLIFPVARDLLAR